MVLGLERVSPLVSSFGRVFLCLLVCQLVSFSCSHTRSHGLVRSEEREREQQVRREELALASGGECHGLLFLNGEKISRIPWPVTDVRFLFGSWKITIEEGCTVRLVYSSACKFRVK